MRKVFRRPGFWIAVTAVVVLVAVAVARARGPEVRTVTPVRRDLEQHIVASGRVWVPTRVQVAAQIPGLVLAVGAVEGQRVQSGDLLVQMDDAEARAAVAQARAAVDQASARVDQLRRVGAIVATESLRQAQTTFDHAQVDLGRAESLVASGSVPRVELDNAHRAVDLARAQKVAAEAAQLAAAPMGADSRVALTALLQAQAQLAGANARLAQTRLVALQEAVVLTRSVEPGDVVQPSRTMLVLAAGADTQLVFQPDERNVASIQLGQKARASADAYPAEVFDAEVTYIAPSIDPERGSIEVRLRVADAPKFLKPDMTVSVDLIAVAKKQVLTLPSDAVRGAVTPAPWVLSVEGGRIARRDVRLGIRGEGTVEVQAGIAEGADVVVADGRVVVAGERARVVREER